MVGVFTDSLYCWRLGVEFGCGHDGQRLRIVIPQFCAGNWW